jgi:hypothetical protein
VELTWQAVGVLIVMLGAIATYVVTVERRLNARMTWKAHNELCNEKQDKILEQLAKLDRKIDRNYGEADRKRTLLSDKVSVVSRQVAVLRDRISRDGLDITGSHEM